MAVVPMLFGKSKRGAGIEFLAFVLFFAVTMLLNVFIDIPILTGLSSYVMLVLIAFLGTRAAGNKAFCIQSLLLSA